MDNLTRRFGQMSLGSSKQVGFRNQQRAANPFGQYSSPLSQGVTVSRWSNPSHFQSSQEFQSAASQAMNERRHGQPVGSYGSYYSYKGGKKTRKMKRRGTKRRGSTRRRR